MDNKVTSTPIKTHISAKNKWFDLRLKEVWRYRDLIVLFTRRSFVLTYKQTILGPIWIFLNPVLTSIIHTFVFGTVAGMSTDGIPAILFYLTSNAIWAFFASCVTTNASTFTANAGVFGKVYFPRLTTPISNVFAAAIRFVIQMLMVGAFLVYYVAIGVVEPNWIWWLAIPLIVLQLGIMGMGVGILISSLTTKYRDLSILVSFGVQLWMYATPVVYPISQIGGGKMELIMYMNPVTAPVEMFRYAVLGQGSFSMMYVLISWIVTIIVAILGILMFNKVERTFMDTV